MWSLLVLNYTYNYTFDTIATREVGFFLAGFMPLLAMFYLFFVKKKRILGAFMSIGLTAYYLLIMSSRIVIPVGQYVVNNTIHYYYEPNPFYTIYMAGMILAMIPLIIYTVEKIVDVLMKL